MSSLLSRRTFLSSCAAVSAGGLLARTKPLSAIEPIQRVDGSFFKFSLAAYSYRDLLDAKSPEKKLTLDDFIRDCAKMGLEGTELTSYYFPKDLTPDYLRHLKDLCFRLGLDISGTAVGNDFCHPAGPNRDRELAHVKRWVDHAEMLGAPVIRIFSGHEHGTSVEEAHRLAVAGIEECCDYAGKHGVFLALENHGGLTTTADGLMKLVRDVKSRWFGVNLDTGNFQGDDVYGDLARFAPYAVNVQVKVSIVQSGKRQRADFSRLARILRDAGYRGYVVLEFEEAEEPTSACPRYLDELRAAFRA